LRVRILFIFEPLGVALHRRFHERKELARVIQVLLSALSLLSEHSCYLTDSGEGQHVYLNGVRAVQVLANFLEEFFDHIVA